MTGNPLSLPVYTKKVQSLKPSNYRPISLTCIASKLMEHILVSNIMTHFDSHDIPNPFQHGFRSKHSCELIMYPYKLHCIELKSTETAKYLGVTIRKDLNWKTHIENIFTKASNYNTLKFIKRNIQTNTQKLKETAYNTYVRPQLEYCAPVWHPWQETISYKIERVQRAAARYVLNDYSSTSSVTEMLHILNWQTLEHRRIQNSLIMFYKIQNQLVNVDHHHLTETRNLKFFVPYSRTKYHMNSYFPRTIRYWNSLPYSI